MIATQMIVMVMVIIAISKMRVTVMMQTQIVTCRKLEMRMKGKFMLIQSSLHKSEYLEKC